LSLNFMLSGSTGEAVNASRALAGDPFFSSGMRGSRSRPIDCARGPSGSSCLGTQSKDRVGTVLLYLRSTGDEVGTVNKLQSLVCCGHSHKSSCTQLQSLLHMHNPAASSHSPPPSLTLSTRPKRRSHLQPEHKLAVVLLVAPHQRHIGA
jgi:hypothetical protein